MEKRLALNKNGELTYCTSDEENIGKGRCNHIAHMYNNESKNSFLKRCELETKKRNLGLVVNKSDKTKMPIMTISKRGVLHLNRINDFGNELQRGVQNKGFIALTMHDKLVKRFLKLDLLKGYYHHINNNLDVVNPSVTEALSLNISRILFDDDKFKSPRGVLIKVETKDNSKDINSLGLMSYDYLGKGKTEIVLASHENAINDSLIKIKDYEKHIIQETDNNKILKNMIKYYVKAGVDEEEAKYFILRQAALDIILGNQDRARNPGNSVIIRDSVKKEVHPFNADLGRTLQIDWIGATEKSYARGKYPNGEKLLPEDKDEDLNNFTKNILNNNNLSIFKGSLEDKVNFLINSGFEPINYDKTELIQNIDEYLNYVNSIDDNFNFYLKTKKNVFLNILQDENIKKLIKEV